MSRPGAADASGGNVDAVRGVSVLTHARLFLPVKLVSEANAREHWATKAKRAQRHRGLAKDFATAARLRSFAVGAPGLVVRLTRIGPRKLDDDNLAGSFKAARDGIASAVDVDDGSPWWTWVYDQRAATKDERRWCVDGKYAAVVVVERRAP